MDIVKTVTLKGKRELTLPLENYEAHRDVVDHWIGGGEVCWQDKESLEIFPLVDGLNAHFHPDTVYEIKQREPVIGEVWQWEGEFFVCTDLSYVSLHDWREVSLSDSDWPSMTYAAQSVQAWVAQECE